MALDPGILNARLQDDDWSAYASSESYCSAEQLATLASLSIDDDPSAPSDAETEEEEEEGNLLAEVRATCPAWLKVAATGDSSVDSVVSALTIMGRLLYASMTKKTLPSLATLERCMEPCKNVPDLDSSSAWELVHGVAKRIERAAADRKYDGSREAFWSAFAQEMRAQTGRLVFVQQCKLLADERGHWRLPRVRCNGENDVAPVDMIGGIASLIDTLC